MVVGFLSVHDGVGLTRYGQEALALAARPIFLGINTGSHCTSSRVSTNKHFPEGNDVTCGWSVSSQLDNQHHTTRPCLPSSLSLLITQTTQHACTKTGTASTTPTPTPTVEMGGKNRKRNSIYVFCCGCFDRVTMVFGFGSVNGWVDGWTGTIRSLPDTCSPFERNSSREDS